jgi:hypothetical protein
MLNVVMLSVVLLRGQGKSTYTFSSQRQRISAFRLLALTTEAWRGAESGTLRKTYMLIYPDPMLSVVMLNVIMLSVMVPLYQQFVVLSFLCV